VRKLFEKKEQKPTVGFWVRMKIRMQNSPV